MRISASVRTRGVRVGGAAVAAVAIAGATLAGASAAYAAPGDSGNIDVRSVGWNSRGHDGVEVCKFVLNASNFESFPAVPWTITAQPPTVPPGDTLQSTLPLVNGSARSQEYLLPEGTYQLVWIVPAGPKQKSFRVDCSKPANNGGRADRDDRDSSASGAESNYEKPSGGVPMRRRRRPGHDQPELRQRLERRHDRRPGRRGGWSRRPDHGPPIRTPSCPQRGVGPADDDGGRPVHAVSR